MQAIMINTGKDGFTPSLEGCLYLFSRLYGAGVSLRHRLYGAGFLKAGSLPCRVISVGNLAVGGTGKTPMTIYVAGLLKGLGYRVVVISRGYQGRKEKSGGIVSDGQTIQMGPQDAGDEPYLMALKLEGVPVLVGKDRFRIGMMAVREFVPDVLVLDDGFQHLKVHRDLDLLLLDASRPFGNGHLLPRGVLREPIDRLNRGDAIVLTRSDGDFMPDEDGQIIREHFKGKPVFRSKHVPDGLVCAEKLPLSDALKALPTEKAWQLALSSGDDYELCFTVSESHERALQQCLIVQNVPYACIGSIKKEPGLLLLDNKGSAFKMDNSGYQHFV